MADPLKLYNFNPPQPQPRKRNINRVYEPAPKSHPWKQSFQFGSTKNAIKSGYRMK